MVEMVKVIRLFRVECSSEEEGYTFYFDGEGTEEEFKKDVRDCIRQVLNEKYAFVRVDENTFIRKRAIDRDVVKRFLDWLRSEYGYKGKVWVDYVDGFVVFTAEDGSVNLDVLENCPVSVDVDDFMDVVECSEVVRSEEFTKMMEERGWERVVIENKGYVKFYEWGGFVQLEDGEWYNNVWNVGYRKV